MSEPKDSVSYTLGLLGQALREVRQVELVKETEGFDVATDSRRIEACVAVMRHIQDAQVMLRALGELRREQDLIESLAKGNS